MKKYWLLIFIIQFTATSIHAQQKEWSLNACIDTAIQKNISLAQNQVSTDINGVNLQQARDNQYPNLNITDAPAYNLGKTVNASTGSYVGLNTATNSFAIGASVNVYSGSQYKNIIKQDMFIYESSKQGVEKLKDDITLGILSAYLQVLYSYEQVDIAQSQVQSDTDEVVETAKFVKYGKEPELNLLQIQSTLAADKLVKVNAQNLLEVAKVNLMQLMNIPVDYNFDIVRPKVSDSSLAVTPLTSGDIYNIATGFLPDLKSAQLSTKASEYALKVSHGLYLPKLSLSGSINTSGNSLAYEETYPQGDIGFLQSNPTDIVTGYMPTETSSNNLSNLWNQTNFNFHQVIGLNLIIPVYNNSQAKNSVQIARLNIKNAKLNEDAVKQQIRISVEQAYTTLREAAGEFNAAMNALSAEERTYSDLEKKYLVGENDATDFLVEKSNYLKAQQAVAQAKYNYLFQVKLVDFYLNKPITL